MSALVEIKGLKKYFDVSGGLLHAVDDVNMRFEEGTTMGVVGESGCGKSTLGRTIIHLLEPTGGQILYQGRDITKVSPRELTIRIKKLLRRAQPAAEPKKLTIGELTVLPDNYQAFLDGEELTLTAKELDVLAFLLANRGKVLTREHILNAAWGYEYCGDTRAVDTLIKRLRQKLGREGVHFAIRSVYGIGYKMEEKL